jgi:uncharacterized protein (TIGR02466 family)
MIESFVQEIFPTPIYFSKINREFSKEELSFIKKTKSKVYKNAGNTTSSDTYILNNKIFKNLKKEIDLIVEDYFNKVISPIDGIKPYITQSWLNYTEKNQYHHMHEHTNAIVSGVLYIDSNEKFDKIKFFKGGYTTIVPEIKKFHALNSTSWWFSVKTKDVILFPSSLTHMVETKQGDNTRISLAFNVFVKGKLGNEKGLTELIL